MRAFVILACVALAYGRPEPPVGYSYSAPVRHSAPSSSYGAPSLKGPISLGHSGGYSSGGISLSSSLGGHSSGHGHSSLGHSGISLGSSGHSSSGLSLGHSSGGISLGGSGFGGDSYSSGYAGGYSSAPLVQKHIYVHVPPPEPQEYKAPRIHSVAAPQKHYKIIFIKAPAPPAPTAPIIPIQPQNEEKTLVYVLVKKPDEQPDIVIPTPVPTQPSKPEVYFIKYQTQKESSGSINLDSTIGGGASLGAGASASGHGGAEIAGDYATGAGDDSGAEVSSGGASTQYGPPGHVAGPLH